MRDGPFAVERAGEKEIENACTDEAELETGEKEIENACTNEAELESATRQTAVARIARITSIRS